MRPTFARHDDSDRIQATAQETQADTQSPATAYCAFQAGMPRDGHEPMQLCSTTLACNDGQRRMSLRSGPIWALILSPARKRLEASNGVERMNTLGRDFS